MRNKGIYILLLIVFYFIFYYSFVYIHEQAHQEVYVSYGIDGEIRVNFNGGGEFRPEEPCPNDFCTLANDNVDSFGYQLQHIFTFFFFTFLLKEVYRLYGEDE